MMIRRRTDWLWLLLCAGLALAPPGATAADEVRLDRVDNAVRARLERVEALSADRKWDEVVDILRILAETPDAGLMAISERRFVGLRDWCQMRLAVLPPEALKLYRGQVDPVARQWYEQGIAKRDRRLLQQVVDRAFAGSYGDDALMALGEMNLESGDYAAARRCWRRILPPEKSAASDTLSPFYPDTNLDPAAVRARLVLASILDGRKDRARAELAQFARLYPNAKGRLGQRRGKYVDLLKSLLTESATWPAAPSDHNWTTFAGNPRRNRVAAPLSNVGSVVWRIPLSDGAGVSGTRVSPRPRGEGPGVRASHVSPLPPGEGPGVRALSFHPVLSDKLLMVNTHGKILAVRLDDGRPAWGRSPTIYRGELAGVKTSSANVVPTPRFTMTVFRHRLYARMGSPGADGSVEVCLDLAAQGRLLWKIEPEDGWAFEGSPLADDRGVYVAMRRLGVRTQAFVACLELDTGRTRWRRFVCGAETPAQSALSECSHNLLTLAEGTIYFNTNLGAVAALRADDGRISWLSLYPREFNDNSYPHYELNPCLFSGERLFVAPADSPRIFAFDAADGQLLWQTGPKVEDAVGLLGTTDDHLIAGGEKLYWIGLKDEDRGKVKHVWPSGAERPGYGRGLLAGRNVLWPTRDKLYIFDQQTAKPLKAIDLAMRGATGGNLLTADGKLLIATDTELIAISIQGKRSVPAAGNAK